MTKKPLQLKCRLWPTRVRLNNLKLKHWFVFSLILICCSCLPDQNEKPVKTSTFYDINGLIDEQVSLLDSISPTLFKTAVIDGVEEISEFIPADSAAWAKELFIFKSADINKPILADSYQIQETIENQTSGKIYKSNNPGSTEVDSLMIYQSGDHSYLLKIQAGLSSRNVLFESEKMLELHFKTENNRTIISAYKIEGWQKMKSRDSTYYTIEGRLIYL